MTATNTCTYYYTLELLPRLFVALTWTTASCSVMMRASCLDSPCGRLRTSTQWSWKKVNIVKVKNILVKLYGRIISVSLSWSAIHWRLLYRTQDRVEWEFGIGLDHSLLDWKGIISRLFRVYMYVVSMSSSSPSLSLPPPPLSLSLPLPLFL